VNNLNDLCVHCNQPRGKHSYAGYSCPLPKFYKNGVPLASDNTTIGPFFDYQHQYTSAVVQKIFDDAEKTMGEFIDKKKENGQI
jgi:hypothetical protein